MSAGVSVKTRQLTLLHGISESSSTECIVYMYIHVHVRVYVPQGCVTKVSLVQLTPVGLVTRYASVGEHTCIIHIQVCTTIAIMLDIKKIIMVGPDKPAMPGQLF